MHSGSAFVKKIMPGPAPYQSVRHLKQAGLRKGLALNKDKCVKNTQPLQRW